jgi:hypothetical protein
MLSSATLFYAPIFQDYDAIIVFTDNETNSNTIDPSTALQLYRNKTGLNTKLIVVALTSNGFSIADPNDANMTDIAGFDACVYESSLVINDTNTNCNI